jgi:hypothetical protein
LIFKYHADGHLGLKPAGVAERVLRINIVWDRLAILIGSKIQNLEGNQ